MASAALTCSIFLSCYPFSLAYGWNLILSVSYGLMGYNLCQASNITLWLDGVIWLPVIMLGIWKLISSGKTLLLYFSVIISIISNWYTAYMICLFSFFFFTYEVLKQNDFHFLQTIKQQFRLFIQYCITMIAGVLTTMFFFFPVIRNLLQGKGVDTSGGWIISFMPLIKRHSEGGFCSNCSIYRSGAYFFPWFQLFSYPWLDTFFSAKENIKSESGLWDIWFFWYSVQYLFLWKTYGTVFVKSLLIIAVFPLLSVFHHLSGSCIFIFFCNKSPEIKLRFVTGCCIITLPNFYGSYQTFAGGYGGSAAAFNQYASEEQRAVTAIQDNEAQTFYRTDQTSSWRTNAQHFFGNFNEGMAYGFMPLSSYSSTYNRSIMYFYNRSGYSSCNRLITWCEPILTSDTLLGIKYVLGDIAALGYTQNDSETYNGKSVYTNPYALELDTEFLILYRIPSKLIILLNIRMCY